MSPDPPFEAAHAGQRTAAHVRLNPALPQGPHSIKPNYIHADMTIKDRALALVTPATVAPGRYTPSDDVLAYLDSLG